MSTLYFRCERCNTLDHMKACPPCFGGQLICYSCQFGGWHDRFEKTDYDSSLHEVVNPVENGSGFSSFPSGGSAAMPWDYDS